MDGNKEHIESRPLCYLIKASDDATGQGLASDDKVYYYLTIQSVSFGSSAGVNPCLICLLPVRANKMFIFSTVVEVILATLLVIFLLIKNRPKPNIILGIYATSSGFFYWPKFLLMFALIKLQKVSNLIYIVL